MPPFDIGKLLPGNTEVAPCGACPVRSLAVCSALHTDDISQLADIMVAQRYDAQHTFINEGDFADQAYNITSGTVKMYKLLADGRRQIMGFLYPGDFIGLAVDQSYPYSVETVVPTAVCRFPRKQLDELMAAEPRLQKRMLAQASHELAAAQDQMLLLGRKTAREKIASFIMMLSRRAMERGQQGNPVHLPMGRADIADFLGLTTETVSRTFTQLKTSGTIRLREGSKVAIIDRPQLEEIADGV